MLVSDKGVPALSIPMSGIPPASSLGRRVVVTGMAGAGKSTFSRALSAKTGLPVIHLDVHFWKPGWVKPSEDEWREKQRCLLASESWIVDGNYHATLDLRLERAETVVFLDTPWWICAGRAFVRGIRKRPVGWRCPRVATILSGDGCAMNGGWSGASGEAAAQSPSKRARWCRSTVRTRRCMCWVRNEKRKSFSAA